MGSETTHDGRIAQLPQQVVDKIAAGEVVVRPVNAVKELLENSLDAEATEIRVEISQGGLELIRIQDNGRGIARGDMPLVCSRFATSKLHAVEELRSIGTFGFRGEALASISIVADRVTITSKKFSDKCAHRALYREGKMESDCTSVAGLQGTIISVDRLFQNAPARKAALRYPNEESNRIADLLVKYAIQFPSVSFAFRRISSSVGGGCGDFRSSGNGDQHGTIRTLLHAKMAKAKQDRQKVFHLFINGRCVECVRLKQAIDAVFAAKDAYCPFVNLSLEIEAHRVDVNVHPTKSIVHFLEQDRIIERIEQELHHIASQYHKRGAIELKVSNSNFGKDSDSQSHSNSGRINNDLSNSPSFVSSHQSSFQQSTRIHQNLVVTTTTPPSKTRIRVDASNRSMDEFTEVITTPSGQGASAVDSPLRIQTQVATGCCASSSFVSAVQMVPILTSFDSPSTQKTTQSEDNAPPKDVEHSQHNPSAPRHFELHALVQLRRQICLNADAELGKLFREHYLIGFYDAHHALIQSGTSVFLLRSEPILQEFFYQLIIFSFGNIGSYALQSSAICGDVAGSPLPVRELLALYLTEEEEGMDSETDDIEARIEAFSKVLLEHKDLLWNFFSINIVDFSPEDRNEDISSMPMLGGLPCILEGYLPQMASIPALITHLARSVDYSDEGLCYSAIARALGHFFTPFVSDVEDDDEILGEHQRIQTVFRSIIFPALKSRFLPPSSLWSSIERVTDIEQAFRHFGRC
uniref:DNA mismatch repair protein S5 domain-containing protein n=1 Tax=Globodera rostochiensis TaxID=31243 RepID=A0A914HE97_GLORO